MLYRKSIPEEATDKNEVDTDMEKGKKREPVRFKISDEDETEALIPPPQIVVDPPSKQTTPDQPPSYSTIDSDSKVWMEM